MSEMEVCWHGASWRGYEQPVMAISEPEDTRASRDRVLSAITDDWQSVAQLTYSTHLSDSTVRNWLATFYKARWIERMTDHHPLHERRQQFLYRKRQGV